MARWLLVHHDAALFRPEDIVSVVAVIDDYIISSDNRGVFKVIEKSVLAFPSFLFPETSTGNTKTAVLGILAFCLMSRI